MKSYSAFNYNNTDYELTHLNAFYTEFIQPASAQKSEKIYRCLIEFSHHCFTKSPNIHKGESLADYPEQLYYITEKETRLFCFTIRYIAKKSNAHYKNKAPQSLWGCTGFAL